MNGAWKRGSAGRSQRTPDASSVSRERACRQRTLARGTVSATALRAAESEYLHPAADGYPRDNRDSHRNADAQPAAASVG